VTDGCQGRPCTSLILLGRSLTEIAAPTILAGYFHGSAFSGAGMFMEGTGLKKKDLKRFREILLAKKKEILRNAQRTLNEDMTLDADDLPDEMDLASSEYLHSFTFRLRGREKVFLQKIDHALEKIKEGTFGVCEQCGEPISLKRLEARLETTLCIRCKEDQERIEKAYG
jgi:RNA polymerase-binding transcription factor